MNIPPNTADAKKIATVEPRRKIHLQVNTAASVIEIAKSRDLIESPPPLAGGTNIQLTTAMGPVEIEWGGELWARSTAAAAVQVTTDV